jgi:serine/threonine-protein kinase HipA
MDDVEQQFRRMVFNIIARNQDDHVKNIAFLMDKTGAWTASHQMMLNGKRDGFVLEDFRACARAASMKRGRAETILEEVRSVVSRWPHYADAAGVPAAWRDQIHTVLRLKPFSD